MIDSKHPNSDGTESLMQRSALMCKDQHIRELQYLLSGMEKEMQKLSKEKDERLEKFRKILKGLFFDKKSLESEAKMLRFGLESAVKAKVTAEEENNRLRAYIAERRSDYTANSVVRPVNEQYGATIDDLIESKKTLAYEKEELSIKVKHLEEKVKIFNRSQEQVISLRKSFDEVKEESLRIRQTLETVMLSHEQLQHGVQLLEAQLAQKDARIVHLLKERDQGIDIQRMLQKKLNNATKKMAQDSMEDIEENFSDSTRKNLKMT